jgi:excisionase family DNA binding protein
MTQIHLKIGVTSEDNEIGLTLNEHAVAALVALLRQVLPSTMLERERRQARIHASQHAHFGGEEPPKDKGLLIDMREAGDLFGVSERTIAGWVKAKRMPAPIRLGRAVRWGYEELRAWVNAGCPPQDKWEWPRA